MVRQVAGLIRTASAAALVVALFATIAASANLLIPAVRISVCGEPFADAWMSYWQGVGFMLAGSSLWCVARMLGSGAQFTRALSVLFLVILGAVAMLTWILAVSPFADPDQRATCPSDARGAAAAAAAFPALMPLLSVVIAEASARLVRLPWFVRPAIVLLAGATLAALLAFVLLQT